MPIVQPGGFLPSSPPDLMAAFPLPSLSSPASGQRRNSFGHGFQLADGLAAKDQRDKGAYRHDDKDRAEEYRCRPGVWLHQERRQPTGEQPPERLAEDVPAAAQGGRELLGQIDAGG